MNSAKLKHTQTNMSNNNYFGNGTYNLPQLQDPSFYSPIMLFSAQKFLATKASASAATWFATSFQILHTQLKLHSSGENAFESSDVLKVFPVIIKDFLKKSPPTWPGQMEVLKNISMMGDLMDLWFSMVPVDAYKGKIVELCTMYYCNAFYRNCDALEADGSPKGALGKAALESAVEAVFSKQGTNDFFKLLEAEWS
jgi:hypothetical protein